MRTTSFITLGIGLAALQGCASTPGAQPADMSGAQHEQAATMHESQASAHQEQFNPNAQVATYGCGGPNNPEVLCWTDMTNPTKEHTVDADKHRKMAADHRAASQSLRDTEARSCAGLSNDDRDMSPFSHRDDITTVQAATEPPLRGKGDPERLMGAVVNLRAVPMLTSEWLQRIVDCHVAANNVVGNEMPEMAFCPLAPKGITAKVSSNGAGFAIRIESQDPNTAKEVLRRAQALKNPG